MIGNKPQVLAAIEELSTDWLTTVMGAQVTSYTLQEIVGEGYASRMYRLHLHGEDQRLPDSVILKLATTQETQVELMEPDVFCREVSFYKGLGKKLEGSDTLLKVYFAEADKAKFQLTLLFEDLGDIPHKPWLEGIENSLIATRTLAKIHASYWQSEELLESTYAPVESQLDLEGLLKLLQENLDTEAAADYSYPYLRDCMVHVQKLARWVIDEADQFSGPMTLVHGDFHARNIHFMQDRVVVFDWQVTERGRPVRDLIYWLLMCVDVNEQKEAKPRLIDAYLNTLAEHGIEYKRGQFLRDFNESLLQMISRVYCYQTLVALSEDDKHELVNWLDRTETLAKAHYVRAQLCLARVLAPPIVWFLRLIGKR